MMTGTRITRSPSAQIMGLSVWLFTACISLLAQGPGSVPVSEIGGIVIDPQGSVICGVQVLVTEYPNGRSYRTATDCAGHYRVSPAPGSYTVSFAKKHFRTDVRKAFELRPGEYKEVDTKLQLNNEVEEPDVTIVPAVKETAGSAIRGTIIDDRGNPVPARLTLFDDTTQTYRTATTDSGGLYRFMNVSPGNYCLHYEAGEWGDSYVEVPASAQPTSADIRFHPRPQTIEVCSASCPIKTVVSRTNHAGIELRTFAESTVAVPDQPLWLTITLTNKTRHTIVVPEDPLGDFANLYAYDRCACPGQLHRKTAAHNGLVTRKPNSEKSGGQSILRIPRGGSFTDRVDLGQFLDWNASAPAGQTFAIVAEVAGFSGTKPVRNTSALPYVESNTIRIMVAPRLYFPGK